MYIARASIASTVAYGRIENNEFVRVDAANAVDVLFAPDVARHPLSEVKLLSPVEPTKVVALAGTYLQDPTATFDPQRDRQPFFFLKPPSAIVGNGDSIEIPPAARGAVFECELAVVIERRCKAINAADAHNYVLGYTICNDVSAPAVMASDQQWSRGKGMDTFCPIGPVISTHVEDPDDVFISADLIRDGSTRELVRQSTSTQVWSMGACIEYVSQYVTLEPGDVVSLGCPPGPIPMEDGDEIRITLDGIGTLVNPVRHISQN